MSEIESSGPGEQLPAWRARLAQALDNYRRMLAYVRPYWLQLALAGASLVAISLLNLALPWAVQNVVDLVVTDQDLGRLNRIALILAGLFVLRAALGLAQTYLVSWVGERVVLHLRQQIYDHVLSLSLSFFARQRIGELVSRVTNDVQVIQAAVTSNIIMLLQQIVTTTGIIVVVATMNLQLSLLLAIAIPGMILITRLLGRRMRIIARQVQDKLAQAASVVEETVGGIRIVKSFAREAYEAARLGQELDQLFDAAMRRTRIYAALGPLISLLLYGSMALVLWAGGRQVLLGQLTPGQLIAFLLYAFMLTGPLSNFATIYSQVQAALGATERVFELLDTRPEIVPADDARPLPPIVGHVVLDDVSFDYDPRQPVLRHVTLKARPGEVVALVGPSGVGKTTLVNLIPRFYDPTTGSITIDGHDIRQVALRSLREQIGVVPQETMLFSDTVAANIRYGRLDASQDEVVAAARAANAHQFIVEELADGYESQVGERGVKLSGGQRQRIAIARAILKNPRILILDEATSSLDSESEQLVQEALDRLMHPGGESAGGRTTFIIAHRLSTVTGADRIVVLDEGRVVEQGSHEELLTREDGLYYHYHALQFRWDTASPQPPGVEGQPPAQPPAEDWPDFSMEIFPSTDEPGAQPDGPS